MHWSFYASVHWNLNSKGPYDLSVGTAALVDNTWVELSLINGWLTSETTASADKKMQMNGKINNLITRG